MKRRRPIFSVIAVLAALSLSVWLPAGVRAADAPGWFEFRPAHGAGTRPHRQP